MQNVNKNSEKNKIILNIWNKLGIQMKNRKIYKINK